MDAPGMPLGIPPGRLRVEAGLMACISAVLFEQQEKSLEPQQYWFTPHNQMWMKPSGSVPPTRQRPPPPRRVVQGPPTHGAVANLRAWRPPARVGAALQRECVVGAAVQAQAVGHAEVDIVAAWADGRIEVAGEELGHAAVWLVARCDRVRGGREDGEDPNLMSRHL